MSDGFRASTTDRDEAGQPLAPVDKVRHAVKFLVHNATEEFGFVPRDVYDGVLELHPTRDRRAAATRKLDYPELQLSTTHALVSEFSRRVFVVFPCPSTSSVDLDHWVIDFKSVRISRGAVESMRFWEDKRLREMYEHFHRFSDNFALAGWVFEAIVRCIFSDGWQSGPTPQPVRMVSNGRDPPVFSTDPSSLTPDTSLPSFGSPRAGTRAVTRVNFTNRQLGDVTLDNEKCYILTTATRPLFDSFAIDLDPHTLVISVFRITISPRHKGSAEEYPISVKSCAMYASS